MTTSADEHRDRALEHVRAAVKELSAIVIDEVSGYEEFTEEYLEELGTCLSELLTIRQRLSEL